jgi:hypothetical protein
MALLFVVGLMNVLRIALLALVVLLEKLTPWRRRIAQAAGIACVVAGIWMVFYGPAGKAASPWVALYPHTRWLTQSNNWPT